MNRYLLQDVDCILAMSGGMDSVALLHWLLENNIKPYIFTKFFKSNDVFNDYLNHKLKKIKAYYQVPMVNWYIEAETNTNGFADREKTKQYFQEIKTSLSLNFQEDADNRKNIVQTGIPGIMSWSFTASYINAMHPWISEIYWGMCYGGLLQRGDQKGDRLWDYVGGNLVTRKNPLDEPLDESNYDDRHKDLFNGPIATLKSIGVNTTFVSPIGHYSKKELYEMLPSEVREMVTTCSNPWLKDWNECGICKKCESLIKVKEACGEL